MGRTNGLRPFVLKSEGDGYMLSVFVAQEIGFRWEMTAAELAKVNDEWRGTKKGLPWRLSCHQDFEDYSSTISKFEPITKIIGTSIIWASNLKMSWIVCRFFLLNTISYSLFDHRHGHTCSQGKRSPEFIAHAANLQSGTANDERHQNCTSRGLSWRTATHWNWMSVTLRPWFYHSLDSGPWYLSSILVC